MPLRPWSARSHAFPGAPGLRALAVAGDEWRTLATDVAAVGGRLLCLWASGTGPQDARLHAAYLVDQGGLVATLPVDRDVPYPAIDDLFAGAARMQRAIADLCGLRCTAQDQRPWLRHMAWPDSYHPLAGAAGTAPPPGAHTPPGSDAYAFVRVEGDGVHEIAVGPVHAGIIEPGHFRFSVVGEKVLRLEERLGYAHKGIELRFTQLPILQGHQLAARICGDSAVAYSWAYCQALEGMAGVRPPRRALWLRALLLELERLANHLGDLGALGNDAGFAFGLAQFSRLKESLLRANQAVFSERYLLNAVVPGGTRRDLDPAHDSGLRSCIGEISREVRTLRAIYDEHEGVRDRFNGAGRVDPQLARRLGLTGLAGRASGQAFDLRVDLPCEPYAHLAVRKQLRPEGDVAARVALRFDELQESCRLADLILGELPDGEHLLPVPAPPAGAAGAGLIEGWRGPVWIALEAGPSATIRRCHPHDPSWHNWPVLEHAIMDNIVPDFPLINKSFNLAYSGHDL